jgi:hypothetical protein
MYNIETIEEAQDQATQWFWTLQQRPTEHKYRRHHTRPETGNWPRKFYECTPLQMGLPFWQHIHGLKKTKTSIVEK